MVDDTIHRKRLRVVTAVASMHGVLITTPDKVNMNPTLARPPAPCHPHLADEIVSISICMRPLLMRHVVTAASYVQSVLITNETHLLLGFCDRIYLAVRCEPRSHACAGMPALLSAPALAHHCHVHSALCRALQTRSKTSAAQFAALLQMTSCADGPASVMIAIMPQVFTTAHEWRTVRRCASLVSRSRSAVNVRIFFNSLASGFACCLGPHMPHVTPQGMV